MGKNTIIPKTFHTKKNSASLAMVNATLTEQIKKVVT